MGFFLLVLSKYCIKCFVEDPGLIVGKICVAPKCQYLLSHYIEAQFGVLQRVSVNHILLIFKIWLGKLNSTKCTLNLIMDRKYI